jgi:hypothetical protein
MSKEHYQKLNDAIEKYGDDFWNEVVDDPDGDGTVVNNRVGLLEDLDAIFAKAGLRIIVK